MKKKNINDEGDNVRVDKVEKKSKEAVAKESERV